MFERMEESTAQVFEIFEVRFADLAEEKTFKAGPALAIIGSHLSEEPMRFATATGAAIADGGWTVWLVAQARGGTGCELAGLKDNACFRQVEDLVSRAAGEPAGFDVLFSLFHSINCELR